jgi:hypothetical protein
MSRRFRDRLIREKISKLERKLSGFDVPLVIVHLDYRSDSLNEAYQAGLAQLASTASRASTFCRSRAEIAGAVASAFHTVTSHYCLVLRLPDRHSKVVQVELENGGRTLTYRNRFVLDK